MLVTLVLQLLRLMDTAGIREASDEVERLGVERSRRAMEHSQLILAVVDGSEDFTEEDRAILEEASRHENWILITSKQDLSPASLPPLSWGPAGHAPVACISLSSRTGEGLDALEEAVGKLFPEGDPKEAGSLLTDQRQEEAARRARDAIARAKEALEAGLTPDAILTDAEEALEDLGELTGRSAKEANVSEIFSRYCVGK